ncbi:MAG: ion transporter [Chloroflexi bacterium]|nr:ion transporter [Chloroflexota bacterium]
MVEEQEANGFKSISYELFILALSILSIVNILLAIIFQEPQLSYIIFVVDLTLSFIFMADFLYRLKTAPSKRHYIINQLGWLDFIGGLPLPQAKIVRLARIIRAGRLMQQFGLRKMIQGFINDRANSALYTIGFLVILMLEFGSVAILKVEQYAPGANITTANDALWWTVVTMSTVGYGDQYPVTLEGRTLAIFVILLGVGLFGVITGFLANAFLGEDEKEDEADQLALETITATLAELQIQIADLKTLLGEGKRPS